MPNLVYCANYPDAHTTPWNGNYTLSFTLWTIA